MNFLTEISAFPRNYDNSDTLNLKHDDEERHCLCKHINNFPDRSCLLATLSQLTPLNVSRTTLSRSRAYYNPLNECLPFLTDF